MIDNIAVWFKFTWAWFMEHPEVAWSGIGTSILVLFITFLVWLFKRHKSAALTTAVGLSKLQQRGWPDEVTRSDLIERLISDTKCRLASSLHEDVSISLKMDIQYSQVFPSLKMGAIGKKPDHPVPDGKTIKDVYNLPEIQGKLLILGQPGSGKTTTLLELSEYLLDEAQKNSNRPVPVIFECSTWAGEPIVSWLADQMKIMFRLSPKIGQKLIEKGSILPFIDGLDELKTTLQELFIQQINEFQLQQMRLVICSRIDEYKHLSARLNLNGAVYIEPLSQDILFEYLHNLNCFKLIQFLQKHPPLLSLAQTPLFLSIMVLCRTTLETDVALVCNSEEENRKYLLNEFIKQKLGNEGASCLLPSIRQKLDWLTWLAELLKSRSQTEFALESLQPTLLKYPSMLGLSLILLTMLAGGLIGGLAGALAGGLAWGLAWGLFTEQDTILFSKTGMQYRLTYGIVAGLAGWLVGWGAGGLVVGLVVGLLVGLLVFFSEIKPPVIDPVELIRLSSLSSKNNVRVLFSNIASQLVVGLVVGLIMGGLAMGGLAMGGLAMGGLAMGGLAMALTFGLLMGLAFGLTELKQPLLKKKNANQGIRNSMLNALFFSVPLSIFFALLLYKYFSSYPFLFWFMLYLIFGGQAYIEHYCLRFLLWRQKRLPFQYVRFLDEMSERKILQRVGGSYRFLHLMLRDHIASRSWDKIE